MLRPTFTFALRHRRGLTFGAMLMALSSFGQTYYISLFGADFRAAFNLTDGTLGAAYAAGTVCSALTLTWAGRLIDLTTVRRFTWCVAALLCFACLLAAGAVHVAMLCLAFYCLRLGGQGLMMHTALTATARATPDDAGKALGIASLGFSVAQAVLPPVAVLLISWIGWRWSWVAGAGAVLVGTAVALTFLPKQPDEAGAIAARKQALAARPGVALWRDPRLLLTLPAILAAPFIVTGFFFHQTRLAEEKGWTLAWIAGWFVVYAMFQAAAQVAIGPVIDRFGPRRLMPLFLMPMGIGMAALGISNSIWAAPVYLILAGLSLAVASTLATALWVELYGPDLLARVRSAVEALLVVATGASPILMGFLIDWGVPLHSQALGCLLYIIVASLLATRIPAQRATCPPEL